MKMRVATWTAPVLGILWASPAFAATLEVGPGRTYATITDAMAAAMPGDTVEVQGGQTYAGTINFKAEHSGTATQPITVRGVLVGGKRPVLTGVGPGEWDNMVVLLGASHFVLESFEVIGDGGDANDCVLNMADDVTLRDLVIHNCRHQGGVVGNDKGSGSLTLEYSDIYHNGDGESSHQIYMATDEDMYPRSVFRMQFCYVHDGLGGNNVKSRAERNEIYYNWIEGAFYHELDLIGPDVGSMSTAREDSDVVGNVLIKNSEWRIARIGGDGSGNTAGRYRFVNNTMVLASASKTAIGLQETVETLEMYNNVIYGPTPGFKVYEIDEPSGTKATFSGSNNWVLAGATDIPTTWTNTIMGVDPGWVDPKNHDLRPTATSPLVDQGTTATAAAGSLAFVNPLPVPAYNPVERRLIAVGTGEARNNVNAPDIGAFEQNAAAPGPPMASPPSEVSSGGCSCRVSADPPQTLEWLGPALTTAVALARLGRRRRPLSERKARRLRGRGAPG